MGESIVSNKNGGPWLLWVISMTFYFLLSNEGVFFSQSRADRFAAMISNCNLLVLDSFGSKFTWQARCRGGRLVSRRLDRGLCDIEWRMRFPEATIEHLVRRQSDHNPLLLRCCTGVSPSAGRPFRFQAAWCTHEDYHEIVKQAWRKDTCNISVSLKNVMEESQVFNKEVFGNIFRKKREYEARLQGIQKTLERVDSASLLILQQKLLKEYEEVLFQEETLWFQKSREKWVRLGSRNTSFFSYSNSNSSEEKQDSRYYIAFRRMVYR